MADLTITAELSRTELALAALDLNDGPRKIIRDEFGPGVRTWRRVSAESPYTDGRYLVTATKEQVETPLGVRVIGVDEAEVWTFMSEIVAAIEQSAFTLTYVIAGVTHEYQCEPADYSVGNGGFYQSLHLMSYRQEIRMILPRFPIPTQGPF